MISSILLHLVYWNSKGEGRSNCASEMYELEYELQENQESFSNDGKLESVSDNWQ